MESEEEEDLDVQYSDGSEEDDVDFYSDADSDGDHIALVGGDPDSDDPVDRHHQVLLHFSPIRSTGPCCLV